jgi:gluconolactonase
MTTILSTTTALEASGSVFVALDPEFLDVTGDSPRLEKVVDVNAHEGPVYVANEDALYFTMLPEVVNVPAPGSRRVAIKRLQLHGERFPLESEHLSVVVAETRVANGMTLGADGHLLVCEQGTRSDHARVARLNRTARRLETVVDGWRGLRLNSPNDVVEACDGSIWFTDPSYGFHQGFRPEPMVGDVVCRFDPRTNHLNIVADSFSKPNGLAFSPDESVLYVADSGGDLEPHGIGPRHVMAFDVRDGKHLGNARLFAVIHPGFPDGVKVDAAGRVYVSSASGVQVFNAHGDPIGEITVPGAVNFTFGGPRNNILFITADTAIWAAVLKTTGVK